MNKVSVVIRVRNGAPYLEESIASVLEQSWPPAEVIVVEGGSTDGSIELLGRFAGKVRLVPQRRRGLAGAAQDGVDAATCPLIAFQDADDVWPQNRLAEMVGHLDAHAEWDGVMGRVEHFLSPDLTEEERRAFAVPAGPQPGAGLPSLVVRRTAFDRAGEFLDGLNSGEYLEWSDRAAQNGVRIEAVETLCLHRRVHLNNFTRRPESKRDYLRALHAVLSRRRQAAGTNAS